MLIRTRVRIIGMSCEDCVALVTEALMGLSGVESVVVSLENNNAIIEHSKSISLDKIEAVIAEAGYEMF